MKRNSSFPDFSKKPGEVEPAAWKQVLVGIMIVLFVGFVLVVLMNPDVYHFVLSCLK